MNISIAILCVLIAYFIESELIYHENRKRRCNRSKNALKDDRPKYFH